MAQHTVRQADPQPATIFSVLKYQPRVRLWAVAEWEGQEGQGRAHLGLGQPFERIGQPHLALGDLAVRSEQGRGHQAEGRAASAQSAPQTPKPFLGGLGAKP